jgi:predicted RNase H-like HicB family nuclease
MDEPVDLTIVFEPPEDGWIVASIPQLPGVHSQGRTREEAREMVLSALSDWLRWYVEDQHGTRPDEIPDDADTEHLHLTFAA